MQSDLTGNSNVSTSGKDHNLPARSAYLMGATGASREAANNDEIAKLLESALQANLRLQVDLMSQIDSICKQKFQNRLDSAKTVAVLGSLWSEEKVRKSEPYKSMPYEYYKQFTKRLRQEYEQENITESFKPLLYEKEVDGMRKKFRKSHRKTKDEKKSGLSMNENKSHETESNLGEDSETKNILGENIQHIILTANQNIASDTEKGVEEIAIVTDSNPKRLRLNWKTPKKLMSAWQYNPDRRWHRRFFVDPAASIPKPNDDTLKRRQMEKGIPFSHLVSPWSRTESQKLRDYVEQVRASTIKASISSDISEKEDAKQNNKTLSSAATSSEKKIHIKNTMKVPDSMIDFKKVSALSGVRTPQECKYKYFYDASPSINKTPFTRTESIKIMEIVQTSDENPSWDFVAKSLGSSRTPFQCFQHFMTKLDTSQVQIPWTQQEDDLLLRYIAACGPQFVLSLRTAGSLGARLLPGRPAGQILNRAHHTLANPKFIYDKWSDDEERILALSIRAYCKHPSPQLLAGSHFPTRCSKMVVEKWIRSLSPEFSTAPFTPEEDRELANIVRKSGYSFCWKEIAQQFPNRRPFALKNRWLDLASSEELLKMHDITIKKKLSRRGILGEESILHPNDLVLRKRKSL